MVYWEINFRTLPFWLLFIEAWAHYSIYFRFMLFTFEMLKQPNLSWHQCHSILNAKAEDESLRQVYSWKLMIFILDLYHRFYFKKTPWLLLIICLIKLFFLLNLIFTLFVWSLLFNSLLRDVSHRVFPKSCFIIELDLHFIRLKLFIHQVHYVLSAVLWIIYYIWYQLYSPI